MVCSLLDVDVLSIGYPYVLEAYSLSLHPGEPFVPLGCNVPFTRVHRAVHPGGTMSMFATSHEDHGKI